MDLSRVLLPIFELAFRVIRRESVHAYICHADASIMQNERCATLLRSKMPQVHGPLRLRVEHVDSSDDGLMLSVCYATSSMSYCMMPIVLSKHVFRLGNCKVL